MDYLSLRTKDIELWREWKSTGSSQTLALLLNSMDSLLQTQINKFMGSNIPRSALEAEARRLAVGAFSTYDPSFNVQLSTHVVNHLKHLQRYVLTYQNVGHIPEHRGIMISRYQGIKDSLEDKLQREPSVLELADTLSWSPGEVERMEIELRKDLFIGQDEEETFFDRDYTKSNKFKDLIEFTLYSLTGPKRVVMEYSFGIGGKPRKTVSEIARAVRMSEIQVRNIQKEIAESINNAQKYY
jgi:DNA-directed RNA polymerase sigma subunit (sigma70/sigma32)